MANILAVDDNLELCKLIRTTLERDGHRVETRQAGRDLTEALCRWADCILLDVMMPGEDGFAVCRRIRSLTEAPILFLSARTDEAAVLEGLGIGADDFLSKPFRVAELRARVAAHLRRQSRTPAHRMVRSGVAFDLTARSAAVEGKALPLTRSEYAICEYLALHAGQTFTKEQIYEAVFGIDGTADDTAVTQHIKNIRAKLRAAGVPEPETLLSYILREIAAEKDLEGKKVLVTAGPTQESIDPVRYITNHSSGKMGYALAKAAMLRGADVTLVSGPCSITPPPFVKVVPVVTAKDMFDAVTFVSAEQDIIIKAAAVADYRPKQVFDEKVKKQDKEMSIELKKTDDILKYLGEHRTPQQFLCGFSMETQNMIGNSRAKLGKKHLDMVAANNLKVAGAGFQGDTNVLTLITQDEDVSLQLMSKEDAANVILDKILSIMKEREQ